MAVQTTIKIRGNEAVKALTAKLTTFKVTVPPNAKIIDEILRLLRTKNILHKGIVTITRNVYEIACIDTTNFTRLIDSEDLKLFNQPIRFNAAYTDRKLVYVHSVPYWWDHGVMEDLLKPYGVIHRVEFFELPERKDTVRRVIMTPTRDLPHAFLIENHRVNITYRGMIVRCFRCNSADHKAADCTEPPPLRAQRDPDPKRFNPNANAQDQDSDLDHVRP